MALLEILTYPDPRLAKKAVAVEKVDDELRKLIDDMIETMYSADGVGLAAPQVGVSKRVIVLDTNPRQDADGNPLPKQPIAIVNPLIAERSEEKIIWEEGCLSVPEYTDEVERSERVVVTGLDRDGAPLRIEANELLGVCLQHEIDHLDGVLFVDRLSRLKQTMVKKKLKRRAEEEASTRL
jgi:peptide deformylase